MAETSVTLKIDKIFLECGICSKPFKDPRGLPCLHTFCCECLVERAKTCSDDQGIVICPSCEKVYQIPEGGVKSFPVHKLVTNVKEAVDVESETNPHAQYCEKHVDEKMRYFCEPCGYAVCSDCCVIDQAHAGHKQIRLKKAIEERLTSIQKLLVQGKDAEKMCQIAIRQSEQILKELESNTQASIDEVNLTKDKIMKQLDDLVKHHKLDIQQEKYRRAKEINGVLESLQVQMAKIKHANEQGKSAIKSGSEFEITSRGSRYESLSASLKDAITLQPVGADSILSHVEFLPVEMQITSIGRLFCETANTFKTSNQVRSKIISPSIPVKSLSMDSTRVENTLQSSSQQPSSVLLPLDGSDVQSNIQPSVKGASNQLLEFEDSTHNTSMATHLRCVRGIVINHSGDIVVTSTRASATVFSWNGDIKRVLQDTPSNSDDIAITHSNEYIIPGFKGFHRFDSQGKHVCTIPTFDINNRPSDPCSVAIDSHGRIILGLGLNGHKTVSIHGPDGEFMSHFETQTSPWKLACTANNELVISFTDDSLQIMQINGLSWSRARTIHAPPGVESWEPGYICCSLKGELFVGNQGSPYGVFRYVHVNGQYQYKDCINDVKFVPWGIALSHVNDEILVVRNEHSDCGTVEVLRFIK